MITVFIAYMVILIGIVFYSARLSKTNQDFVLGGKKLSGFSLALSERATGESAWLLLGLTGHAYAEGMAAIWVALGCVTGILFLWIFLAELLQCRVFSLLNLKEQNGVLASCPHSSLFSFLCCI